MEKSQVHWTRRLEIPNIIAFLIALVVHGVFDLGFKSSDLPCFCPFERRFADYWYKMGFGDVVNSKNNFKDHGFYQKKAVWNPQQLIHHASSKSQNQDTEHNWPHYLLNMFLHNLYDEFDEDLFTNKYNSNVANYMCNKVISFNVKS